MEFESRLYDILRGVHKGSFLHKKYDEYLSANDIVMLQYALVPFIKGLLLDQAAADSIKKNEMLLELLRDKEERDIEPSPTSGDNEPAL